VALEGGPFRGRKLLVVHQLEHRPPATRSASIRLAESAGWEVWVAIVFTPPEMPTK
jgi:hypothetical protein